MTIDEKTAAKLQELHLQLDDLHAQSERFWEAAVEQTEDDGDDIDLVETDAINNDDAWMEAFNAVADNRLADADAWLRAAKRIANDWGDSGPETLAIELLRKAQDGN